MHVELTVVADPGVAAEVAARLIVDAVRAGGAIALSGGSTPGAAYERAAALEADWSAATVWLADERCVPPDDPLANTRLVHEAILDRVGRPPAFRAVATALGPETAATRYDAELREEGVPGLVLLGVGSDGHTASLFPRAPALEERERLAVAAVAGLEPFVPRVTLTLPAIARASHVVFLVTGAGKAEQVRRAFASAPSADVPASLARSADGRTTVIVDAPAAALLA